MDYKAKVVHLVENGCKNTIPDETRTNLIGLAIRNVRQALKAPMNHTRLQSWVHLRLNLEIQH